MENLVEYLKQKFKQYKKSDIVFTTHAKIQAQFREIDLEEVKENIINPKRLYFVERQEADKPNEEKYNCYFGYSKTRCHRYVVVVNKKCLVCTVIKINRRWQYVFEKKSKKRFHFSL